MATGYKTLFEECKDMLLHKELKLISFDSTFSFVYKINYEVNETSPFIDVETNLPILSFIAKIIWITDNHILRYNYYNDDTPYRKQTMHEDDVYREANIQQYVWAKSVSEGGESICPSIAAVIILTDSHYGTSGSLYDSIISNKEISQLYKTPKKIGIIVMPMISNPETLSDITASNTLFGKTLDFGSFVYLYANMIFQLIYLYLYIGIIHFDSHTGNVLVYKKPVVPWIDDIHNYGTKIIDFGYVYNFQEKDRVLAKYDSTDTTCSISKYEYKRREFELTFSNYNETIKYKQEQISNTEDETEKKNLEKEIRDLKYRFVSSIITYFGYLHGCLIERGTHHNIYRDVISKGLIKRKSTDPVFIMAFDLLKKRMEETGVVPFYKLKAQMDLGYMYKPPFLNYDLPVNLQSEYEEEIKEKEEEIKVKTPKEYPTRTLRRRLSEYFYPLTSKYANPNEEPDYVPEYIKNKPEPYEFELKMKNQYYPKRSSSRFITDYFVPPLSRYVSIPDILSPDEFRPFKPKKEEEHEEIPEFIKNLSKRETETKEETKAEKKVEGDIKETSEMPVAKENIPETPTTFNKTLKRETLPRIEEEEEETTGGKRRKTKNRKSRSMRKTKNRRKRSSSRNRR